MGQPDRGPVDLVDVEYSFSRTELQPVLGSIREALGCGAVPLDSPARLQTALGELIQVLGGRGQPIVRRSPAAMLTPEYWSIGLKQADSTTRVAITELIARGQAE